MPITRTKKLISILDVFHDASIYSSNSGQRSFYLIMGILFETNPWAQHTPDTLARRKYDSQMNIARAIIHISNVLLRTSRGKFSRPAVSARGMSDVQAHVSRAEGNLGHIDEHRTSRFATSLSAGHSDAGILQCLTIFASASE
jgi:hypothetical protein